MNQHIHINYPSKTFIKAVKIINARKKKNDLYEEFDYPDYAGLPKKISNLLNSDEVDLIQNQWKYKEGA